MFVLPISGPLTSDVLSAAITDPITEMVNLLFTSFHMLKMSKITLGDFSPTFLGGPSTSLSLKIFTKPVFLKTGIPTYFQSS